MRVTRITIDQELGIISLTTGPGGDGDYVLLPLDLPDEAAKYVRYPDHDTTPEPSRPTVTSHPDGSDTGAYLEAAGGWSVPADQAYDFNTTDGIGAYQAATDNPPQFERGGYKYGEIKFTRSPEPQKMHDGAMVNDFEEPVVSYSNTPYGPDERDGVIPGITPAHADDQYAITDVNGYVITALPNDRENYTYHPGEGRWLPNPLPVYADEHGRGYRLSSPHIPYWSYDIQKYELHRVPTLALEAAKRAAKDTTNTDVAVIIKEMS